jgi:hypothetical protein
VLDPKLVASTVAAGLRVPVPANQEVLDALHEALGDRRLLVVLDNCEQVVESAAELVARPGLAIWVGGADRCSWGSMTCSGSMISRRPGASSICR